MFARLKPRAADIIAAGEVGETKSGALSAPSAKFTSSIRPASKPAKRSRCPSPRAFRGESLQCLQIRIKTEPEDLCLADIGDDGGRTKRLTPMDIGKMHLDRRLRNSRDRIAQRIRIMGKRAWIDDDAVRPTAHAVQVVDQSPFMIRLIKAHVEAKLGRAFAKATLELVECQAAVDIGLALTEKVKIWSIDDQYIQRANPMWRSTDKSSSCETPSSLIVRPIFESKTKRTPFAPRFLSSLAAVAIERDE